MKADLKGITKIITDVLTSLGERGFELPLHVVTISINGTMFFVRYDADESAGNLAATLLTSHPQKDAFLAVPINLIFVDAWGEAARILIKADGSLGDLQELRDDKEVGH